MSDTMRYCNQCQREIEGDSAATCGECDGAKPATERPATGLLAVAEMIEELRARNDEFPSRDDLMAALELTAGRARAAIAAAQGVTK